KPARSANKGGPSPLLALRAGEFLARASGYLSFEPFSKSERRLARSLTAGRSSTGGKPSLIESTGGPLLSPGLKRSGPVVGSALPGLSVALVGSSLAASFFRRYSITSRPSFSVRP